MNRAIPRALAVALVAVPDRRRPVLDPAHRPTLGHAEADAMAAIRYLMGRCDPARLEELAAEPRLGAALVRARAAADR